MPYRLSATLKAHSSDVRALSTPRDDLVLSASRDSTAISWHKSEGGGFAPAVVFKPGTRYVNAVTYLPPSSDAPRGYVVTGGQDTVINVFSLDPPQDEPTFSLLGHVDNVCALDASPGGAIISGSWDKTAKIWINFTLAFELKAHTQSVWAVKAIDEEQFLTGSADKTIIRWHKHKAVQTFKGHQDAVRGLALVPDIGFASCSNDSEIRVWTLGGDLVYTLSGHTSFVYSLSLLPNNDIVSGGEDRSVRIWQDGECAQVIVHPAISVWAVATMPNGDIVSGCSDGVVRIFSAAEDRWASEEDLKDYEAQVASQTLPSQQVGDVKKSDLPGPEALSTPGKKPGEVKMIKNGDVVEAHQWDSGSHQWQKIGDVVDAVGQGRKQLYEGKEYDYVFDVDIAEGRPPLKLPYNVTENPYAAAQRFLQENDISLSYIDQVAQFIEKNTSGVNLGSGTDEYVDPYTGASRYRGTATADTARAADDYADPFTGASRYRTSQITSATPAPAPQPPSTSQNILPMTKALNFKQANISAMQGKLNQLNDALRNEISTSSLAMFPKEVAAIDEIFAFLNQVTSSPPRRPSNPLSSDHVEIVIQILERWPSSQRFPVLDLCRLLVMFSPGTFNMPGLKERLFEALIRTSEWNEPWTAPLSKPRETNILLVLRTMANAVQEGTKIESTWLEKVFETLRQVPYNVMTKPQRVAFGTILFNVSCAALQSPLDSTLQGQHLALILHFLALETADSEAVYRTLVALGNVAYVARKIGRPLQGAQIGEMNQYLRALPTTFPEERVKAITAAIAAFL